MLNFPKFCGVCGQPFLMTHECPQNAAMAKTLAQRQADFRKAMKDAGFVLLTSYVTKEQRDKFRQLGGDEWLRKRIDRAKLDKSSGNDVGLD